MSALAFLFTTPPNSDSSLFELEEGHEFGRRRELRHDRYDVQEVLTERDVAGEMSPGKLLQLGFAASPLGEDFPGSVPPEGNRGGCRTTKLAEIVPDICRKVLIINMLLTSISAANGVDGVPATCQINHQGSLLGSLARRASATKMKGLLVFAPDRNAFALLAIGEHISPSQRAFWGRIVAVGCGSDARSKEQQN